LLWAVTSFLVRTLAFFLVVILYERLIIMLQSLFFCNFLLILLVGHAWLAFQKTIYPPTHALGFIIMKKGSWAWVMFNHSTTSWVQFPLIGLAVMYILQHFHEKYSYRKPDTRKKRLGLFLYARKKDGFKFQTHFQLSCDSLIWWRRSFLIH
jgi:phosphate/sulfate permease